MQYKRPYHGPYSTHILFIDVSCILYSCKLFSCIYFIHAYSIHGISDVSFTVAGDKGGDPLRDRPGRMEGGGAQQAVA
jgi:hypothetical protein